MSTHFYAHIHVPIYILLLAYTYACYILICPYTYTCLHTTTLIYLYMSTNFHVHKPIYIYRNLRPYTHSHLHIYPPIYAPYVFIYFYAHKFIEVYIILRSYKHYAYLYLSIFPRLYVRLYVYLLLRNYTHISLHTSISIFQCMLYTSTPRYLYMNLYFLPIRVYILRTYIPYRCLHTSKPYTPYTYFYM
jgi:hypothetical protein